jgi:osmotically-inducible protein OsmY
MRPCMPPCILTAALLAVMIGCGDQSTASSTTASPPSSEPPVTGSGAEINRPHPDNSAANKRDGQEALTPMNQGAGDADIRETANIRKAIMADPMLSIDAQNIKVITNKGLVTLRGVVDSIDEHKRVARIVQNASGTDVFDDQLKVK